MKATKSFVLEASGKALISLIPVVGSPVLSLISDVLAERKQQRLDEFFKNMKADLDHLSEKLNTEFISQPDFLDIFELTSKKLVNERTEVKRLIYKDIIVNGMIIQEPNFDEMEQCIRLVENTTESNIIMLKVLNNPKEWDQAPAQSLKQKSLTSTIKRAFEQLLPKWSVENISENLKDLEYLGLIFPMHEQLGTINSGPAIDLITNKLTLKGKRFVKYILKSN